ncbi:MAG: endonuclease/exonuclease/phosphatase family protein, partial [Pseudomonadota bacterium]
ERKIVTWNLQKVSLREENRRRLRRVCERIEREGWEIVLVQELSAVGKGVIWLGEGENRVAILHSVKAGIILRGSSLDRWIREGQHVWYYNRVVAITLGKMRLVSVYQPIWRVWGPDRAALEECRRDVETQLGLGRRENLVIGGDFNASVGRNRRGMDGVYGRFGIGEMNEAGRDLMEWCGINGLAYVNSYMRHERRGTWQHPWNGRWYELDGFLMRKEERHRLVKRMKAMNASDLSDHAAKSLTVKVCERRWRTVGGGRRPPRIKWEALQRVEKRAEYMEKTRELMTNEDVDEWKWEGMTEVMIAAAKDVCGETTISVANPWTVGCEEELDEMKENTVRAVRTRGERLTAVNEMREMDERREERVQAERELVVARRDVRECRRRMKRRLRELEREWWQEKIDRCEAACEEGRVGDMYKILREIGMRGKRKAGRGGMLTANDYKRQFERVSSERYEERPEVIEGAVRNARDLREDERAIEANEKMNEIPSVREIVDAMKDMKESAPGEDGVRISFIRYACEELQERVIEMVQKMFVSRANDWSEGLKGGIIVPLYKKGDREDPGNYRGVCLLAMGSRILARVIANRLGWWAEHLGLLDENQAGFRKGRSTADMTQMMV